MKFVLFTDKTTSQCMRALHDRIQAKQTKTRPELDGWIEKSGRFSLSLSSPVLGKLKRTTRLRASAQRDRGQTIIRGFVPTGASSHWLGLILMAVIGGALYFVTTGELVLGLVVAVVGTAILLSLYGDYRNHDVLLHELEKTLKAKPAPAKKRRNKK